MSDKPDWFDAVNQQFINIGEIHKNLQLQLEAQRAMLNLLKMRIELLEGANRPRRELQRQQKAPSVYVDEEGMKEIR